MAIFCGRGSILLTLLLACATVADAGEVRTDQPGLSPQYSGLTQIDAGNVKTLQVAWRYDIAEAEIPNVGRAFEDAPSLIEGNLIVCTPTRRVIALDPATGHERWVYDPKETGTYLKKCRGVASWVDHDAPADAACKTRLLLGTSDYRLIAIDAKTGRPCDGFGTNGEVHMEVDKPELFPGERGATELPAIVNGVVVVGSIVADNQRLASPSGRVQAFDARSGRRVWTFDPIPRDPSDPAMATWLKGSGDIGGSNVWAPMSVDEALDLVYLPTTSPSDDYYGGARPGANAHADSVVALKGATGEIAWSFQLVHHDLWDYDVPSAPLLIDLPHDGKTVPAAVQNTKMGMIFAFDRKTGEPLIPIEERPVPQEGAVPGEWLSPTQPFPVGMPILAPHKITPEDAWGFTPIDRWLCRKRIAELNYGPIYTPPSSKGTILQPASAGGTNWGGGAYDPNTHLMVVASNRVSSIVTLVPRQGSVANGMDIKGAGSAMIMPSEGSPYITKGEALLSPLGAPCTAPPWATLTAVDLSTGQVRWEVPLGSIEKLDHIPIPWELGTPGTGGPLITAGGLVFIGYTMDEKLRAFDLLTGKTLWTAALPANATATPVTYEADGEQYVVINTGGHIFYGPIKNGSIVAYKLKR